MARRRDRPNGQAVAGQLPTAMVTRIFGRVWLRTSTPTKGPDDDRREHGPPLPVGEDWRRGEIKRRTEVIGIFPEHTAIIRLVGLILTDRTTDGPCSAPAT